MLFGTFMPMPMAENGKGFIEMLKPADIFSGKAHAEGYCDDYVRAFAIKDLRQAIAKALLFDTDRPEAFYIIESDIYDIDTDTGEYIVPYESITVKASAYPYLIAGYLTKKNTLGNILPAIFYLSNDTGRRVRYMLENMIFSRIRETNSNMTPEDALDVFMTEREDDPGQYTDRISLFDNIIKEAFVICLLPWYLHTLCRSQTDRSSGASAPDHEAEESRLYSAYPKRKILMRLKHGYKPGSSEKKAFVMQAMSAVITEDPHTLGMWYRNLAPCL